MGPPRSLAPRSRGAGLCSGGGGSGMQRWFLECSWGALSCFWSRGDELSSSQRALLAVISPRLTLGASGEAQGRKWLAGLLGLGVSEGAAGPRLARRPSPQGSLPGLRCGWRLIVPPAHSHPVLCPRNPGQGLTPHWLFLPASASRRTAPCCGAPGRFAESSWPRFPCLYPGPTLWPPAAKT